MPLRIHADMAKSRRWLARRRLFLLRRSECVENSWRLSTLKSFLNIEQEIVLKQSGVTQAS
jgi:hypothetical protein